MFKDAQYGHIGISKCMEVDTGHFGCQISVLDILDARCSGKQECEIAANDQTFRQMNPCKIGLDVFLELSYLCVDGE